jgi:hypothetical protein
MLAIVASVDSTSLLPMTSIYIAILLIIAIIRGDTSLISVAYLFLSDTQYLLLAW